MRLLGASAIFSSMILTSCDSTKGSNSEAEDLKNQIEEFNAEADRQSAEYIEIIDGLEEKNRDLLNETQDLKALLGTTQKELQALNAEFDDYQDQAAAAVELYISRFI